MIHRSIKDKIPHKLRGWILPIEISIVKIHRQIEQDCRPINHHCMFHETNQLCRIPAIPGDEKIPRRHKEKWHCPPGSHPCQYKIPGAADRRKRRCMNGNDEQRCHNPQIFYSRISLPPVHYDLLQTVTINPSSLLPEIWYTASGGSTTSVRSPAAGT